MHAKELHPDFAVSEQIGPGDLAAIAAAGYRSIICNRPDNEGPGQPSFAEIETAARAAALEAAYLPVAPGQIGPQQIEAFGELMLRLPKPVLGYCRSGARASGLWEASKASRR
jgi:sulfide:quinone oxidoreductase